MGIQSWQYWHFCVFVKTPNERYSFSHNEHTVYYCYYLRDDVTSMVTTTGRHKQRRTWYLCNQRYDKK